MTLTHIFSWVLGSQQGLGLGLPHTDLVELRAGRHQFLTDEESSLFLFIGESHGTIGIQYE